MKIIIVIIMVAALQGCIVKTEYTSPKAIELDNMVELKESVLLEQNKECYIQEPYKMIKAKNYYIIYGFKFGVLVFDNKGKFIRRIGKKGNGPGEYSQFFSVHYIDENNIVIHSTDSRKMLIYNINGELISEQNTKTPAIIENIIKYNDNYYLYGPLNENYMIERFDKYYNYKDGVLKIPDKYAKYLKAGYLGGSMLFMGGDSVAEINQYDKDKMKIIKLSSYETKTIVLNNPNILSEIVPSNSKSNYQLNKQIRTGTNYYKIFYYAGRYIIIYTFDYPDVQKYDIYVGSMIYDLKEKKVYYDIKRMFRPYKIFDYADDKYLYRIETVNNSASYYNNSLEIYVREYAFKDTK